MAYFSKIQTILVMILYSAPKAGGAHRVKRWWKGFSKINSFYLYQRVLVVSWYLWGKLMSNSFKALDATYDGRASRPPLLCSGNFEKNGHCLLFNIEILAFFLLFRTIINFFWKVARQDTRRTTIATKIGCGKSFRWIWHKCFDSKLDGLVHSYFCHFLNFQTDLSEIIRWIGLCLRQYCELEVSSSFMRPILPNQSECLLFSWIGL